MQKIANVKPNGEVNVVVNDIDIVAQGVYNYRKITATDKVSEELDLKKMVTRRYLRAIRLFRTKIDSKILEVYQKCPHYRDEDISGLLHIMLSHKDSPCLSEMLYDYIKKKENVRKENNKKRREH